jgi:hypothetical protein
MAGEPPRKRLQAIPAHMASTTPNGHAPERNPYTLDSTQKIANANTNVRPRASSAYISIIRLSTVTPTSVSTLKWCLFATLGEATVR